MPRIGDAVAQLCISTQIRACSCSTPIRLAGTCFRIAVQRSTAASSWRFCRVAHLSPLPAPANACGQGRDRTGDLPLFRRTLVPTELPGPTATVRSCLAAVATLTGLEPATSAVTGRRANQLRHRALLLHLPPRNSEAGTPYGIRTRATALKGRRPRPLDEGGQPNLSGVLANAMTLGASIA